MKSNSTTAKMQAQQTMLRMDPDTGEIDCLVPVEAVGEVVSEGECAWRVLSAHEMAEFALYQPPQDIDLLDVGCEFDGEIDVGLDAMLQQSHSRPMVN